MAVVPPSFLYPPGFPPCCLRSFAAQGVKFFSDVGIEEFIGHINGGIQDDLLCFKAPDTLFQLSDLLVG